MFLHGTTKENRNLEGENILCTEKMSNWKTVKETEEEEKPETKKGKRKGEETPEVKMKERSHMQAVSYKTIMHNFAGISA